MSKSNGLQEKAQGKTVKKFVILTNKITTIFCILLLDVLK